MENRPSGNVVLFSRGIGESTSKPVRPPNSATAVSESGTALFVVGLNYIFLLRHFCTTWISKFKQIEILAIHGFVIEFDGSW
jgi:hypothetical protein